MEKRLVIIFLLNRNLKKKEIESLRQAVTKLSSMLVEKGLSEDDLVADFQEFR
jgi:hypothetical protein